jgi:hypothetical protein
MEVSNNLAHYIMPKITAVKSFMVQAQVDSLVVTRNWWQILLSTFLLFSNLVIHASKFF